MAALLSFAALALPFFLGQVYVADDLGEFHLPLRNFYAEQLARHEPFDWMPSLYGGFYVTAEGQLGAYHPLHVLLYRTLPLGAAFDLELLVSYPFMFGGMYLLLRRWLARRDASLAGALVFTFGGFNLLHFVHPNAVAIVAHIPWLLLAIEASLTEASGPRRATADLAIGLLTASQLLLGYPQYVWFSLLVETAYAVWRTISLRVGISRVVMPLIAVTLGVLTAGVQLLPTIDGLSHSTRAAADARVCQYRLAASVEPGAVAWPPTCFKRECWARTRTNWVCTPGPCRACCACGCSRSGRVGAGLPRSSGPRSYSVHSRCSWPSAKRAASIGCNR